jgi:hypothetical protein
LKLASSGTGEPFGREFDGVDGGFVWSGLHQGLHAYCP